MYKYQDKCSAVFLWLRKCSVLGSHKQSFSFQLPASTWHERRWRGAASPVNSPKGLVIPVGVEKICRKPGEPWLSGSASNSLGFPADFPYQSIEFSTGSYSWWSLVKGVVRNPLLAAAFNPTQFLAKHWRGNIVLYTIIPPRLMDQLPVFKGQILILEGVNSASADVCIYWWFIFDHIPIYSHCHLWFFLMLKVWHVECWGPCWTFSSSMSMYQFPSCARPSPRWPGVEPEKLMKHDETRSSDPFF